ncbi:purine-cytosine permease family protein [Embleya hyalina]|uniref:purine-cytosine permease family protein n=1 Tax=Embleya hyalina TaxID=516124 RepID=UPI001FEBABE8|nr:cytosine permease [Embleya hyalina]
MPTSARRSWFGLAVQRFGQLSALVQFLVGAALGFGMNFWDAFLALTLGSVILELVAIAIGVIGVREGLSTTVLARWTGFGQGGSALLGLLIGLSVTVAFGIQSAVSAEGLVALFGGLPSWAWSLVFGLSVTAIVVMGIRSMAWTAYLTVPVFLALVAWSVGRALTSHSIGDLIPGSPPGPPMTLVQGTTMVAGSFIVGAVITADMTRFNRSVKDVVKQTLVGVTLGEYVIGLAGVLLAHASRSSDVIAIVVSNVGWVGALIIVGATLKINDWNLYSASLGTVGFLEAITGRRMHRGVVTVVLGVTGSALAAAGVLTQFATVLGVLGYVFPPVAGVMLAEYFVVRRWRPELDASRASGTLPDTAPQWVPATLVVWAASATVGGTVSFGFPSINALVCAFVLYTVAGKAGLVHAFGATRRNPAVTADGAVLDA